MRYISILLALLFAFATTSYALPGNDFTLEARKDRNNTNGGNSLKKTCKTIRKLTKLTELANNQTRLDERVAAGKLTTEKVDQIKAKAANATIELQTLQSNATLVQECAVVNAQRKDVRACRQMKKLERLSQIANNQSAITAISEAKGMSEARLQKFQEKVQEAEAKLQEMQANSTLTEFCAQRQQQKGSDGSGDGASGSSEASTSSGSGTSAAASTGGASSLTLQTVPYALASTLAAVFVLFL